MDKKRIIVLPSNKEKSKSSNDANFKKKKVAAYARVSTGQFDQELSYDAQIEFYDRYIRSNSNWEFVGIYSDKGISGVGVSKRPEFQRMIRDAKEGKIDLILTKSISRFARNTMDTLRIIRELKADNIEVIFEKENISTLDSKSEIVLTILSSLAQEESRSISENVKWSIRKRMASGDAYCDYARLYGYTRNKYGEVIINEAEAKIARKVYELYFLGYSHRQIARILSRRKIPTKFNGKMWRLSNVCSILHNEKYIGDTLFQKTYVKDFLTKKKVKNKGILPQYYVYDTHPSIITKGTYELAQYEYRRRQKLQNPTKVNSNSVSGLEYGCKIICGRCGGCYSRVKSFYKPRS